MKIIYVGNRPMVSIMCSGRVNYVFHKDNDFTQEVSDPQHAAQILRSVQHKFETDTGAPKKAKVEEFSHPAIADTPKDTATPMEMSARTELKKRKSVKQVKVSGGK